MQIVHSIQFSDDEIDSLFEFARMVGEVGESTAYETAEKPALILDNKKKFKMLLSDYAREAFDYGYKVGANTANVKDTAMYS
jgi:hypothetical protein